MKDTARPTLEDYLELAQSKLGGAEYPCTSLKDGHACPTQWHRKHDPKGRPLLWYAIDCPLPARAFCDACLAYWLVAVARNIVISIDRADQKFGKGA